MTEQYQPCNINYTCCDEDPSSSALARAYTTSYPVIAGLTEDLSESQIMRSAQSRGDIDALRNLETSYDRVSWSVGVMSESGPETFLDVPQLSNMGDLISVLNEYVTFSDGTADQTIALRSFDTVNSGGKKIFKVFGKNQAFSKLRGRYWGSEVFVNASVDFPARNEALAALWFAAFGFPFGVAPESWSPDDLACFWMGSNRKRYYRVPPIPSALSFSVTGNGRHCRNPDSSVPLSPGDSFFEYEGSRQYAVFDREGLFIETVGWTRMISYAYPSLNIGNSHLIGIPMTDGTRFGMYLKPMGIDQICTEYFDPSSYRLEAVGSFQNDSQRRIRVLSDPLLPPNPLLDLSGPFDAGQWMPVAASVLGRANLGSTAYAPGDIGFQLRNLETGQVSALSSARVNWQLQRRGKPLAARVANAVDSF